MTPSKRCKYGDYEIMRHQPYTRVFWKVYRDGNFVATYDRLKDAKRRIDNERNKNVR